MNPLTANELLQQHLTALGHFKDWSNYMLVATIAALGWVAAKDAPIYRWAKNGTVVLLAASASLAILTLALIPLIAEAINLETKSFYDVVAHYKFFPEGRLYNLKLKQVCWAQHVFFIDGVVLYAIGSVFYNAPVFYNVSAPTVLNSRNTAWFWRILARLCKILASPIVLCILMSVVIVGVVYISFAFV